MTLATSGVYGRDHPLPVDPSGPLAHNGSMSISHVQLFSIPVSDQDRARDFYVDTLGFELVAETQMGPEMRWVQVRPVGAATSLTLVTWFPTMAPGSSKGTVLETDSLERTIATLREKGLPIGEIETAPWGRFVTIDDPDGNGIVLQETAR
jgi:catechol 2,3-dioxygenase-like lactoylglutathione lyase family enzyme